MNGVNIHKRKLYALIEAGFALIGMFLTWTNSVSTGAYQTVGGDLNGFRSWGYLSLLGIAGVVFMSWNGDKMKDYDKNSKNIVMASFGAIALGAFAYWMTLNSKGGGMEQFGIKISAGPGVWMTLVAGLIGLLWVMGYLDKLGSPSATGTGINTTSTGTTQTNTNTNPSSPSTTNINPSATNTTNTNTPL